MRKLLILFIILLGSVTARAQTKSAESPLIVGVKITPPFIMKSEKGENGYTGLSINLWERIAEQLDISYEYKEYNFLELLEATESGRVGLTINPFSVTSERQEKMDFTQPFYVANLALAVTAGQNSSIYAFLINRLVPF